MSTQLTETVLGFYEVDTEHNPVTIVSTTSMSGEQKAVVGSALENCSVLEKEFTCLDLVGRHIKIIQQDN